MRYEETKPNSERQKDSDCSDCSASLELCHTAVLLMAFVLPSGYGCAVTVLTELVNIVRVSLIGM